MRLGGQVFVNPQDIELYAVKHIEKGFSAALWPQELDGCSSDTVRRFKKTMEMHDIVIAQVGIWRNCVCKNIDIKKQNITYAINQLALADELGATTCMNIVGSRHPNIWDGPDSHNYDKDFRDEVIEVTRTIIDAVKPKHTTFSFEILPYCFLDSPQAYAKLLKDIDRPCLAVHFDPVNCINSPQMLVHSEYFIKEMFRLLGNRIVTIHVKDLRMEPHGSTLCFCEAPFGQGNVNLGLLLRLASQLAENTPVLLEHLADENSYDVATIQIKKLAADMETQFYS